MKVTDIEWSALSGLPTGGDIMDPNPVTMPDTYTLHQAFKLLADQRQTELVVVRDHRPIGAITMGDLAQYVATPDQLDTLTVTSVLCTALPTLPPSTPVPELVARLHSTDLLIAAIVDEGGVLLGIVGQDALQRVAHSELLRYASELEELLDQRSTELADRMAQVQMIQTVNLAKVRKAALDEIVATLRHEMNSPLTSILGFAEIGVNATEPGSRSRKAIEMIAVAAQKISTIIAKLEKIESVERKQYIGNTNIVDLSKRKLLFGEYLIQQGILVPEQVSKASLHMRQYNKRIGQMALERGLLDVIDLVQIGSCQKTTGRRFGEVAIDLQLLTAEQVRTLLKEQDTHRCTLSQAVVELGYLTPEQVEKNLQEFADTCSVQESSDSE